MISMSPSGALSPYYYKGGYFHGIHYGSYFEDTKALLDMMEKEEEFILRFPQRRRILIDLYETRLNREVLERLLRQITALNDRIVKLAIATDRRSLRKIQKALKKEPVIEYGRCYLTTDMEDGKTWLVSDGYV